MSGLTEEEYVKREVLGIILGPIILFLCISIAVHYGIIKAEESHIYWTMAGISVIANLINFFITRMIALNRR